MLDSGALVQTNFCGHAPTPGLPLEARERRRMFTPTSECQTVYLDGCTRAGRYLRVLFGVTGSKIAHRANFRCGVLFKLRTLLGLELRPSAARIHDLQHLAILEHLDSSLGDGKANPFLVVGYPEPCTHDSETKAPGSHLELVTHFSR